MLLGWLAPLPRFPPTYKVKRNVEGNHYEDRRIPSFTDRIAHHSLGLRGAVEHLQCRC
jgi:hypothetical protein